jgi:hypothetical protein
LDVHSIANSKNLKKRKNSEDDEDVYVEETLILTFNLSLNSELQDFTMSPPSNKKH